MIDKKTTVEECYVLGMKQLTLAHIFRISVRQHGALSLSPATTGENIASIITLTYFLNTRDLSSPRLTLFYCLPQTEKLLGSDIDLQITSLHHGGLRWWFSCPLRSNSVLCGRRVAKLYLPPSKQFFGCRRCYNLTHRSAQENQKSDYRKLLDQLYG